MQDMRNDLPLDEPYEADKDPKKWGKQIQNAFNNGADEVRVMKSKKAAERKKQFREWRKALQCKAMSRPGRRKL